MKNITLEKVLFFSLGTILVLYPLFYWGYYAGDAVIHLIYGQNAAHGHLFEFNPGEKTSGETSIAYMFLIGFFFHLFSSEFVPIAIKITNYVSWVLFLYVFYKLLRHKNFNKYIIAAALLAFGLLPGSVYNANIGMENGLFGLIALLWFYFAIQNSYFTLDPLLSKKKISQEIVLGFILGLAVWLRPEAIPFFLTAIGTRFLASIYFRDALFSISVKTIIGVIAFLIPASSLVVFIHSQTGLWGQGSAIARIFYARLGSYHIGQLIIDPTIWIRLCAYFPITIFWIIGIFQFFKSNWRDKIDECFAILLFAAFMFAFTFITGAAQLSRYMIFLTPFWILIAARGVEYGYISHLLPKRIYLKGVIISIIALIGIYSVETFARFHIANDRDLILAINYPKNMRKKSDALYAKLGNPKLPVILAEGEVENRYGLDNRFLIRSLDGRVDSAMIKYFHRGSVDYLGYLKERNVQYLIPDSSLPSYQHTLPKKKLEKLHEGEFFDTEGLRFTAIDNKYPVYKIEKLGFSSA